MSDRQRGDDWWLASDGQWYPPESKPLSPPEPALPLEPEPSPGEGWWLASDGRWYPPESRPGIPAPPPAPQATGPPGEGWWLASDGRWYPPESAPASDRMVEEVRLPARPLSSSTTTAVRLFLALAAALSLAVALATFNEIAKFDTWVNDSSGAALQRLADAEDVTAGFEGFWAIAFLAAAILTIVWTNAAYKAIEPRGASGRRWSSGWAVGAWFIPFANLVIPKLIYNEIDRVSNPDADPVPVEERWRGLPLLTVGNAWWAFFLLAVALSAVGGGITGAEIESGSLDPDLYRIGLWLTVAGYAAYAAAGALAGTVIKTLGDRLR